MPEIVWCTYWRDDGADCAAVEGKRPCRLFDGIAEENGPRYGLCVDYWRAYGTAAEACRKALRDAMIRARAALEREVFPPPLASIEEAYVQEHTRLSDCARILAEALIRWFDDSPDAGDPNCICSYCEGLIEEEELPIRLFDDETGKEARFHQRCAAEVGVIDAPEAPGA